MARDVANTYVLTLNSRRLIQSSYTVIVDEDDSKLTLDLMVTNFKGPAGTPYEGGTFSLSVHLPQDYPFKSPSLGFRTRIYHPNIDERSGSVCLDVINQAWSPMYDLTNIFDIFLPQLLTYGNAADPLNGEAAALMLREPERYKAKVREYVTRFATPQSPAASSSAAAAGAGVGAAGAPTPGSTSSSDRGSHGVGRGGRLSSAGTVPSPLLGPAAAATASASSASPGMGARSGPGLSVSAASAISATGRGGNACSGATCSSSGHDRSVGVDGHGPGDGDGEDGSVCSDAVSDMSDL